MPRRVQDIIPASHRSIRDIPVARDPIHTSTREQNHAKRASDEEAVKIHRERLPEREVSTDEIDEKEAEKPRQPIKPVTSARKTKKKSKSTLILTVLGVIVVLAGVAFAFSGSFAKATFTLASKNIKIDVGNTYIIPSLSSASSSTSFGYETVNLSSTSSTTMPATIGTYTETKAQGTITVYNSYSAQSQRIVAGTRIAGNSGLVYRLVSSVVVPGYTMSGKTIMPGSVSTTMTAEKAGDQYNISSSDTISDFKVIAYKGTAKYDGFYARLTSAVTGGFAGTKTVVSATLLASTTATLQTNLVQDIQRKLFSTVPAGYVMYPNVYATTFTNPIVTSIDAKTARISTNATIYAAMFKKTDFARFLAGATSTSSFGIAGYDPQGIDALSVILANPKDFSPLKKTNLMARISGSFNLSGNIPLDVLKKSFAGIPLSKTADIIKKYAGAIDVTHSSGEIVPPWVTTVPTDLSRISIILR